MNWQGMLYNACAGYKSMSNFFDDTMQGLLQAVEIKKGNVPRTSNDVGSLCLEMKENRRTGFEQSNRCGRRGCGNDGCAGGRGKRLPGMPDRKE